MCGIFAVFGLPDNSAKFRNDVLRYVVIKSENKVFVKVKYQNHYYTIFSPIFLLDYIIFNIFQTLKASTTPWTRLERNRLF